jgi:hypothetical protein
LTSVSEVRPIGDPTLGETVSPASPPLVA